MKVLSINNYFQEEFLAKKMYEEEGISMSSRGCSSLTASSGLVFFSKVAGNCFCFLEDNFGANLPWLSIPLF